MIPGSYQIHKRPIDGVLDDEEDGMCISTKSCKEGDADKPMEAKLAKCSHCGAKKWNILGDADTGYVLTEGDGRTCLLRESGTKKAMTAPCDSKDMPYTPLQLVRKRNLFLNLCPSSLSLIRSLSLSAICLGGGY